MALSIQFMPSAQAQHSMQSSAGLHDIAPPTAPPASTLPFILSTLLLLIVLFALAARASRILNSRRIQARRHLRQLQNSIKLSSTASAKKDGAIEKDTAYRLARILSQGLGLNGITSSTTLPAELKQYHDRWQAFIDKLSQSRFARENSSCPLPPAAAISSRQMFDDARFWLKVWP